jgi:taurine dioxygenase
VFDPTVRAKVKIQPVVWPHPQSGAPILFVSRLIAESIIGLSREDSETLLEELFAYIEDPSYAYVHKWCDGDVLVWDNRQLQHARRRFDPAEPRTLRRVPIAEPAAAHAA